MVAPQVDWAECAFTVALAASGLDAFIHAFTRVIEPIRDDGLYEVGFDAGDTSLP